MTAILARIKDFFRRSSSDPTNKAVLEKQFSIRIKQLEQFELALTHRSHSAGADNERLELLGDAVLDLIVADYIYHRFQEMDEGLLTKLKSKFISRDNLIAIANKEGLTQRLSLNKQKDLNQELIIGNVLEAIFGAIYIDQGYETCRNRAIRMFERSSPVEELLADIHDPKSQLLEWAQKSKKEIRFVIDSKGRDRFEARLFLDQELISKGIGKSKKKSEKNAARKAITELGIAKPE
jgi:ribonuclease-3